MENVVVLFSEPIQSEALHRILESFHAVTLARESWEVHDRNQHVTIDVLPVSKLLSEYEAEDLARVVALLGGTPGFAVSIAYRTGDASADLARDIADALLKAGRSVIDHNDAGADGIRSTTKPFL